MIYKWKEKLLFIKGKDITDFQTLPEDKRGYITGDMTPTSLPFRFIDKYGLTAMVKYLKGMLSTTRMEIPSITKLATSSSWQNPSIVVYMARSQKLLDSQFATLRKHEKERNYGMPPMRLKNGRKSEIQKDSLLKN